MSQEMPLQDETLPIHASSPKSVRREGVYWENPQVPHQIDKTLEKSLYRGDNHHLTSRFCDDELDLKF